MNAFCQNLKLWRLSKDLTQSELASKAGIPRPNLVLIEQGRRECTLTTLYRLAHTLGISPGTLLDTPPESKITPSLDRYDTDLLARHILTNKDPLPPRLVPLKEAALHYASPLLRAFGIKPNGNVRKNEGRVEPKDIEQILQRLRKLLPSYAQGAL